LTLSIYALAIETFVPVLDTLSSLLDKGAEHVGERDCMKHLGPHIRQLSG
jgi:hypothetical protein